MDSPSRGRRRRRLFDDGKCEASVAATRAGGSVRITTCKFFSSELGFGNLHRWVGESRGARAARGRAPHRVQRALHLHRVPPRTNLVLDDAYNDFVYGTGRDSIGGSHSTTCTCSVSRTRSSSSTSSKWTW